MNKERQIRKRTWKYFRQQKWEEIKDWVEDNAPIFAFSMILMGIFLQLTWVGYAEGQEIIFKILAIVGLCMVGFWVLIGIIYLIKCICKWLKDNWKEASKKAKKDFK